MNIDKKIKGFSLVEILIAITFFVLVIGSITIFSLDSLNSSQNSRNRLTTNIYIQEINNAILLSKTDLWGEISGNTGGVKHIEFINNRYMISDGSEVKNNITMSITIEEIYRDADDNIVETGGTLDPFSRKVEMRAEWVDILGQQQSQVKEMYINNWVIQAFNNGDDTDFEDGNFDNTILLTGNEQLELVKVFFPDWCNPGLSINEYDIVNQAKAKSIYGVPGHAYLGTGGNSAGTTLTKLNISNSVPPLVVEEGVLDGFKVNEIFVDGDYAYMSTDTNSGELTVVDVSSPPYSIVNTFDGSGSSNSEAIFVKDGIAYLGQGNDMRIIDVSDPEGNLMQISTIDLGWWFSEVTHIKVIGDYAYIVLDNDWYELVIVNISDPSNPVGTSYTSVNNQQVQDLWMSEDGSRAYFGTNQHSTEKEFWILDTSEKTGTRPVIASMQLGEMNVEGLAVIEKDEKVILVGDVGGSGEEEYRVYDISDELNPTYCGGYNSATTVNDLDSVEDEFGNVFSYIMTDDANSEFKIIRGGPGGGGSNGIAYISEGTYESTVYDTNSDNPFYLFFNWVANIPAQTSLQFQLRAGITNDLSGETWIGPDGTSSTYFTNMNGENTPSSLNGKRYIQYKAYFATNDPIVSPNLSEVHIYFQEP